ncbi:hypothetical protein SKL01_25720 [Staphylococcus kloosii]|uniref:Uncharacterized protein n=1 Tax=Staphylococcus kloosii TaxID=29384 RepID=A0ABQ0XQ40_9STAP|nr:hypothetical protein SKL01_25720 [Staphylococcus kloosii]
MTEALLVGFMYLNELNTIIIHYRSETIAKRGLIWLISVNFTVVHSSKCLYSIYLSSETNDEH